MPSSEMSKSRLNRRWIESWPLIFRNGCPDSNVMLVSGVNSAEVQLGSPPAVTATTCTAAGVSAAGMTGGRPPNAGGGRRELLQGLRSLSAAAAVRASAAQSPSMVTRPGLKIGVCSSSLGAVCEDTDAISMQHAPSGLAEVPAGRSVSGIGARRVCTSTRAQVVAGVGDALVVPGIAGQEPAAGTQRIMAAAERRRRWPHSTTAASTQSSSLVERCRPRAPGAPSLPAATAHVGPGMLSNV